MPFIKGQSGNPAGKPRGCRNKANRDLDVELDAEATQVAKSFVAQAKDGNATAMRLVAQRVLPVGRERPVEIELPPLRSIGDRPVAMDVIRQALCDGEITIGEASGLVKFVDQSLGLDHAVARGRAETNELRAELVHLRAMLATLIGRIDILRKIAGVEKQYFGRPEVELSSAEARGADDQEINENGGINEINEISEINAEPMTSRPTTPAVTNSAAPRDSLNIKQNPSSADDGAATEPPHINARTEINEINQISAGSMTGAPPVWQNEPDGRGSL